MIIGIAGAKRSGKNYVGEALLESIQREYQTTSDPTLIDLGGWSLAAFADPLRGFVLDIFNMDERHSEGHLKEVPVRCLLPTYQHVKASCLHWFGNDEPAKLISKYLTTNQEQYKLINFSYRELMQYIGTELIRKGIDEDFWVNVLDEQKDNLIITDVRMPNEAEFVRDNGVLIHINNPKVQFTGEHSTEKGVDKVLGDLVFLNDPSESHRLFEPRLKTLKQAIQEKLL